MQIKKPTKFGFQIRISLGVVAVAVAVVAPACERTITINATRLSGQFGDKAVRQCNKNNSGDNIKRCNLQRNMKMKIKMKMNGN